MAHASPAALQVRRLGYALGAEVTGLDLRAPLDTGTLVAVKKIWLDNPVLCFPNQDLTKDELMAFAAQFGELEVASQLTADPASAQYLELLSNKPVEGEASARHIVGTEWHTDGSFSTQPTGATIVNCKEMPQAGGNTMFANMYMAYERLSPAMRGIVDGLSAIHDLPARRRNMPGNRDTATVQPLVRVHPGTNRKMLYLSYRVSGFIGMTTEESAGLIAFLMQHATAYEFTYRHRWSVGDLVMWDNRCLMHIALGDYDLDRDIRHMTRVATLAEPSGYSYAEGDQVTANAAYR